MMREPIKIIKRKHLKSTYLIRFEIAMILTLSLLLIVTKLDINATQNGSDYVVADTEEVLIEEIVQTKQQEYVPPPPKPVIPVQVPNDEIIESEVIDFDSELDIDEYIELPAAPPILPIEMEDEDDEEIFVVVEQYPELIGGLAAFRASINYPEIALKAGIEGRVIVQFIVDREGNVRDPVVVRGIGGGCDEEAIRAIKAAKFRPGMQRGRPVTVKYSMPVNFKIQSDHN